MSAAEDVMEMQSLVGFIADRMASSKKDKDRTNALHDLFNPRLRHGEELISWNRCFEFLKGKARIVQSWEKDLAREKRDAIRAAEREQDAARHVEWLRFIHEQAASENADVDRSDLAALERVLSRVGVLDRSLGRSQAAFTDADDRADQSQGWGR